MKIAGLTISLLTLAGLLLPSTSLAISVSPFGPNGEGGLLNGQTFDIAPGGAVYEVDAFVNVAGQDLNGGAYGTSAQLSQNALPAGLDVTFSSALSDGDTDITLTYMFQNNTGAAIADITVISYVDAEIDEPINTLFNEVASTSGTPAAGQGFEADEPGFVFGDIYFNALDGSLDDTNAFPPAEDVAMALSFYAALLDVDETLIMEIMISEDGGLIETGIFSITHGDSDPASTTSITYSGRARISGSVIPEPSAFLVFALGALVVGRSAARYRAS